MSTVIHGARRALLPYPIIRARSEDVQQLPGIELAAAKLLRGHASEEFLDEVTSDAVLRGAQEQGLLWVVLAGDRPVGFAQVDLLEPGVAHLRELDVHPAHGRQGLGTRLVNEVCRWAEGQDYGAVTLTTFRDVPWNAPFYAKLGFEEVPVLELTPVVRSLLEDEARRGLDPERRVAMRRNSGIELSARRLAGGRE